MAKYMYQAKYTVEGYRGLLRDTPSGRRKAIELAVQALGGKLETIYYCFGADDMVAIVDLPDDIAMAGLALNVAASGMVGGRVTTLMTVEDADKALGVNPHYIPPGYAKK